MNLPIGTPASSPSPGLAPRAPPGKLTYQEFLEWAADLRAEWVDGEVILTGPAPLRHQDVLGFLAVLLRFFVESKRLGLVLTAPFQMKSGPDLPGREPDILFVASQHLDRLKLNYLDGPADLVVEIISPDSRARDRGEKYYEYEQAGIREYWLIDPARKQAEFYLLGEDRLYHLAPLDDAGGFRSAVLAGLSLKVDWLWEEPMPALTEVLRELGLVR